MDLLYKRSLGFDWKSIKKYKYRIKKENRVKGDLLEKMGQ
jgi:hypothetical protein